MKTLLISITLLVCLGCPEMTFGQGGSYGSTVFGPNIAIKPGAFVTVCSHPSTVASCPANKITLYSDINLVTPVTNPVTTDGEGHWLVYAPSGTFDFIVTGTGITPLTVPFTFSIGGSGGNTILTNGTAPTENIVAGANITLTPNTPTAGTTTIAATAGAGCTVPGNAHAVLSENPAGTCYDSAHYTWDDTSGKHNLLTGDGTITLGADSGAVESLLFALGGSTTALYGANKFSLGFGNTLASAASSGSTDLFTFGSSDLDCTATSLTTCSHLYTLGHADHIETISGSGQGGGVDEYTIGFNAINSNIINGFSVGHDNHLESALGATTNDLYALCGSCTATIADTSTAADLTMLGVVNAFTVSGVSNSGVDLVAGNNNAVNSLLGANEGHTDILGGSNTVTATGSGSDASFTAIVGFSNALTASAGQTESKLLLAGSNNTATSSSAGLDHAAAVGYTNTIANCSHCYAFGDSISNSTSNSVGIGLSSNPEIDITPGLVTTNASQALVVANASSTGTTINKLAKFTGAPSTAVITSTSDTNGAIGIVSLNAGTSGSASISKSGITNCIFDGATTAGDYVNISGSTAGDCHDAGAGQPLYSIGRVMSTNGGGGTYPVDLQIGAGTGGAVATQGKVALTGQTASISPTALLTTPASPAQGAYRVTTALSCDSSSASATVTFTLAWTDPSNTSQSITSSAATCTTLGAASYQSLSYAINSKEGTAINYSTTIANTPTYSLHVLLEGAW